jgi:hypothetical protein
MDRPIRPGNLSSKAWSATELADLRKDLHLGTAIEEIASFLCRESDEVQQKVIELDREMRDEQATRTRRRPAD